MKTMIQRAISCGVILLSMCGLAPLAVANAASGYPTDRVTMDTLVTYGTNQRTGQLRPLQGKIIVVDPGHGGSDTGAIGPENIMEKQVTLSIAQELRRLLANDGATVIMTRSADRDVAFNGASDAEELAARINVANRNNADLFISIHADSFDGDAGGTTTYFSDTTGDNMQLAQLVQGNMVAQLRLDDRGIQTNDFYVLEHAGMPAILTEIAFISNPREERLLATRSFNKKAAVGIFNGIEQYFQN
ncbi:MAG: N-acetylmuramoyl-L-alanine amidase [Bacillota bacterium]